MTLRERIQKVNRENDPFEIKQLVEWLYAGGLTGRTGSSILFTYADMKDLFQHCDSTITDERFEELMQTTDNTTGKKPKNFPW